MPMSHDSCDHEKTPKARAACRRAQGATPATKQRSEKPVEAPAKRRPSDAQHTPRSSSGASLKALSGAPEVVRTFVESCQDRGWKINPIPVERGHSIQVFSSRGAGQVTWDGDEVKWFTRLGYSSITREMNDSREVWNILEGLRRQGRV